VFWLESNRNGRSAVLNLMRFGCLPLILAVGGLVAMGVGTLVFVQEAGYNVDDAFMLTLAATFGALLLVQVLAGAGANILMVAQSAPLISGEVELQSWGLLRTTTLTLREIVMAKLWAVLNQLRGSLLGLMILRVASAGSALLFLFYLLLRDILYYMSRTEWLDSLKQQIWLPPIVAALVFLTWYLAQPLFQFVFNGALGMAASTFARSRGRAIAIALATRLVLWVTSIVANVGFIYLLGFLLIANWSQPQYAPIEWFSRFAEPSDQAISYVMSGTAILYIAIIALIQIGLVVAALVLTQRRARQLGG
jgi:hypothetical protein